MEHHNDSDTLCKLSPQLLEEPQTVALELWIKVKSKSMIGHERKLVAFLWPILVIGKMKLTLESWAWKIRCGWKAVSQRFSINLQFIKMICNLVAIYINDHQFTFACGTSSQLWIQQVVRMGCNRTLGTLLYSVYLKICCCCCIRVVWLRCSFGVWTTLEVHLLRSLRNLLQ